MWADSENEIMSAFNKSQAEQDGQHSDDVIKVMAGFMFQSR